MRIIFRDNFCKIFAFSLCLFISCFWFSIFIIEFQLFKHGKNRGFATEQQREHLSKCLRKRIQKDITATLPEEERDAPETLPRTAFNEIYLIPLR